MEELKQLPLGYRFVPTDLELIVEYLIKKLKNQQFSCIAVVEHDIYSTEPWNLKGNKDDIGGPIDKRYYFVNREKKSAASDHGKNPNRAVKPAGYGSKVGFWKATGGDKPIQDKRNKLVGVKKLLKYFRFTDDEKMVKDGEKTGWIMHEYTLPPRDKGFQSWVLCSIRFNGSEVEYQKQYQKYLKQEAASHQHVEPVILQQEAPHQQGKPQLLLPRFKVIDDDKEEVVMLDYAKGVEPVTLQQEAPHQQGKPQLLMPWFKVIDDDKEEVVMLDYAKGGVGLPQACEASSTSMSGACSSSANHHQDVPPVPEQDQLTNDNAEHDYGGFLEWEGLEDFQWMVDEEYSYLCHSTHSGTAAFNGGTNQQCAVPSAVSFGLNNKFN